MRNQKVSTLHGTIILMIIAITAGVFVWEVEKKQEVAVNMKKFEVMQRSQTNQPNNRGNLSGATINKGWGKYTSSDKLFSIEYPNDWQIKGSIFYDDSNNKIAEFQPGIVTFKPNQQCFDNKQEDPARVTLISKTNININNQQGVLLIEKVVKDPGGGFWFPNTYCIKKENEAFFMTFYDFNLNSSKKALFNKVIATLEFK